MAQAIDVYVTERIAFGQAQKEYSIKKWQQLRPRRFPIGHGLLLMKSNLFPIDFFLYFFFFFCFFAFYLKFWLFALFYLLLFIIAVTAIFEQI